MTIMLQAYRFALDPTPAQEAALRSHCGGQRYAFNWGLRLVTAAMDQRRAEASYGIPTDELTPSLSWSGWAIPGRLLTAPAQLSAFHLPVWQLLVIMAVVATVIAYLASSAAPRHLPPSVVSVVSLLEPVVATALASARRCRPCRSSVAWCCWVVR